MSLEENCLSKRKMTRVLWGVRGKAERSVSVLSSGEGRRWNKSRISWCYKRDREVRAAGNEPEEVRTLRKSS